MALNIVSASCFNPRPLQSKRATPRARRQKQRAGFQSAPASIEAGDVRIAIQAANTIRFNPRPLQSKRATQLRNRGNLNGNVSIRARFNRSGRQALNDVRGCSRSFNPRPLQSKRATARSPGLRARIGRFNPRPLQSKRATKDHYYTAAEAVVSIRARFNRSGRRSARGIPSGPVSFNPRPLQSKRATGA